MQAIDPVDAPARHAMLLDLDATACSTAVGSEQSLLGSVAVVVVACKGTSRGPYGEEQNADLEDEFAQDDGWADVLSFGDLRGSFFFFAGAGEGIVFGLGGVVVVVDVLVVMLVEGAVF